MTLQMQGNAEQQYYRFVSRSFSESAILFGDGPTGAIAVSRHHTLPPIVYSPPLPEPKKTRPRRGVSHASGARETDDAEEVSDGRPLRRTPVLPQHARPIEAAERRTPSPNGKLSDDTLRAMLILQEQDAK